MTPLRKPVYRVTTTTRIRERGKLREIVVGLEPGDVVTVRLKGTRTTYTLPVSAVFYRAATLEADRIRAERRAKRKGAKK